MTARAYPDQYDEIIGDGQGPEESKANGREAGSESNGHAEAGARRRGTKPKPLVQKLQDFLAEFIPPDYLVDGLLQQHFCYSLTGMTGAGKTAVALRLALTVATTLSGKMFAGRETEHGRVVYLAQENPTEVQMRLIAMCSKLNIDPAIIGEDFLVIQQIGSLEKDWPRIIREITAIGDVVLVIVDTSPSLFQGDEENNNMQLLAHAKRLRKMCDLPGRPCVLALCHPAKHVMGPDQLLPRGGGAFLNEMDGNLTLWAHDDMLTDLSWCGKFRGPNFDVMTFKMSTVYNPQLVDKRGRHLPTVLAEPVSDAELTENEAKARFQEDRMLLAMFKRPSGSLAQWALDCGWHSRDPHSSEPQPNKSLAQRVMKRLKKTNMVTTKGRDIEFTKDGLKAAKKLADAPSQDD
jgi:hypothetical protein